MHISLPELAAVTLAAIIVPYAGGGSIEWAAAKVPLAEPVTAVRQADNGVYARAGDWYVLSVCDDAPLCTTPGRPLPLETAEDGIPGGHIATIDTGDGIHRAWYADPTDRYPHGALGDNVEGGSLVGEDVYGNRYVVQLPSTEVFEDLTPRIVDIDGDGQNEIVTIRSALRSGAAVAVYGLSGSRLIERASTTPIGRANRWLNIAGIADFTGDGQLDIAIVKTPHIGGVLEILRWNRNRLQPVDSADGFSNHAFGSLDQGLSAVASIDGDRIPDLVLPDAQRTALRMVTASGGKIREVATVPLPGEVTTSIGVVPGSAPPAFALGLDDGSLVAVTAQ